MFFEDVFPYLFSKLRINSFSKTNQPKTSSYVFYNKRNSQLMTKFIQSFAKRNKIDFSPKENLTNQPDLSRRQKIPG